MTSENLAAVHAEITQKIARAGRVAVIAHVRPDGDAVGSTIGLTLALRAAGKQATPVLLDGVPLSLRYLAGADQVVRELPADIDLVITVDAADLPRIGGVLGARVPDINIDHHITNTRFGETNLVVGHAVATCAILAGSLEDWGLPITLPVAEALLTGIVTDTIGFRTSNVTPEALRLAANLMETGANLPEIYMRALVSKTYEAARYWGIGLEKLVREDGLVWTTLSLQDRHSAQYPGNDDADLVNMLSSVEATVALIFIEQKNAHVKVSWRARPGYDVAKIALQFGGGGHAAAAGADIPGSLSDVQQSVLAATRSMLARAVEGETTKKK
jgi:phosphoesterase RecJ-like protein